MKISEEEKASKDLSVRERNRDAGEEGESSRAQLLRVEEDDEKDNLSKREENREDGEGECSRAHLMRVGGVEESPSGHLEAVRLLVGPPSRNPGLFLKRWMGPIVMTIGFKWGAQLMIS